ncbi:MAG: hypothetical protein QW292_03945 [Candidatus Parvarchaeota archaeon]
MKFNSEFVESLWSSSNPHDLIRLYSLNRSIEDLVRFLRNLSK